MVAAVPHFQAHRDIFHGDPGPQRPEDPAQRIPGCPGAMPRPVQYGVAFVTVRHGPRFCPGAPGCQHSGRAARSDGFRNPT